MGWVEEIPNHNCVLDGGLPAAGTLDGVVKAGSRYECDNPHCDKVWKLKTDFRGDLYWDEDGKIYGK